MKNSFKKLNLNKLTISNLSAAEMSQQLGGDAKTKDLKCAFVTISCKKPCVTFSGCEIK